MATTVVFLPGTSGNASVVDGQKNRPIGPYGQAIHDHVGFFATGGPGNFLTVLNFQDSTWMVDTSGNGPNSNNPFSGELYNNKYINVTGVSQSGQATKFVSVASAGTLFNGFSGFCSMQIKVTSDTSVEAENTIFGFLNPLQTSTPPTDVELEIFEIIPTGNHVGTFPTPSGRWTQISGAQVFGFVSHIIESGFGPIFEHNWFTALSSRALTPGTKNYLMYFRTDLV